MFKGKMIEGVVDRIENGIAVIQISKGEDIEISIRNLPNGIKEGNVLKIAFTIDREAEAIKRERIKDIQKRIVD